MIDTHAHLDALAEPVTAVLQRARDAGVDRVITIGTGIESSRRAVEIAEREEGVYAALGIHPHDAGTVRSADVATLRALLKHDRSVAVGETGLDFYRDNAPRDAQRRVFETHLELASELDLPVVIHSRAAAAETVDVLSAFEGTVVLHCFSDVDLLPVALDRGYFLSFAGNVTYPKAADLREAAAAAPDTRILVETDSPHLAPQAVRSQQCEPAFVHHTLTFLADVRAVATGDLEAQIDLNAQHAFDLP